MHPIQPWKWKASQAERKHLIDALERIPASELDITKCHANLRTGELFALCYISAKRQMEKRRDTELVLAPIDLIINFSDHYSEIVHSMTDREVWIGILSSMPADVAEEYARMRSEGDTHEHALSAAEVMSALNEVLV